MTGGRVVVLGPTGRNFAAGHERRHRVRATTRIAASRAAATLELVDLEELAEDDEDEVRDLISEHAQRTGSLVARNVLARGIAARASGSSR